MKTYSKKELSRQLSLYLDVMLDGEERKNIEEYLAANPEARRELQELQALRKLLSQKPKLRENRVLWTKISDELQHKTTESENHLPFPRKFMPAVAAFVGTFLIVAAVIAFQKRAELGAFISEKSKIVQSAYEGGVLKGSILPLFSDIDKDQVLQFALFGTLPLDTKEETALHVDEEVEKGYRIEIGKGSSKTKPVTIKDLQREVRLTDAQTKVIDSMLAVMKDRIEASVLVSENDALVIDPELPKLNRVMVSNIAASLELPQRERFNRFLEERDAPYVVATHGAQKARRHNAFVNMHKHHRSEQFVIVTQDTVLFSRVDIDLDSIRQRFEAEFRYMPQMIPRADRIFRKLRERELASFPRTQEMPRSFQVYGDSDAFSIEFEKERMMPEGPPMYIEVLPRMQATGRGRPSMRGFGFHFVAPRDPESLNVRFFDESGIDSVTQYRSMSTPKRYPPKLDSMMRAIEQKRLQEESASRQKPPEDEE